MDYSLQSNKLLPIALFCSLFSSAAIAFDSGSSGADGALNITQDTRMDLPANGIFNFTTINIAADSILTFNRNRANTPVTILASGDVVIDGIIDISGDDALDFGVAENGLTSRDGGSGGPGGFSGGLGGAISLQGNPGFGPGGGDGGRPNLCSAAGAAGGGFGTLGGNSRCSPSISGGDLYGNAIMQPLIGGSGGGGGAGDTSGLGLGGGGGGGAILIASSTTVLINGSIVADGGKGSSAATNNNVGGSGGGGSGGAVRIVATNIDGSGDISATGGARGEATNDNGRGGPGGVGRILLEADDSNFSFQSTPEFFLTSPQPIIIADLPELRIARVAGIVPTAPEGGVEVVLPLGLPNPVNVEFESSGIPLGSTIELRVIPENATPVSAQSSPIAGTEENGTANVDVNIPTGNSTLSAQVSFTVVASIGEEMSRFAQGERVERVMLATAIDGSSETVLVTVSGKEYRYGKSSSVLASADS